jgi:hypothetical protein
MQSFLARKSPALQFYLVGCKGIQVVHQFESGSLSTGRTKPDRETSIPSPKPTSEEVPVLKVDGESLLTAAL